MLIIAPEYPESRRPSIARMALSRSPCRSAIRMPGRTLAPICERSSVRSLSTPISRNLEAAKASFSRSCSAGRALAKTTLADWLRPDTCLRWTFMQLPVVPTPSNHRPSPYRPLVFLCPLGGVGGGFRGRALGLDAGVRLVSAHGDQGPIALRVDLGFLAVLGPRIDGMHGAIGRAGVAGPQRHFVGVRLIRIELVVRAAACKRHQRYAQQRKPSSTSVHR